jgi:hypothetical protein
LAVDHSRDFHLDGSGLRFVVIFSHLLQETLTNTIDMESHTNKMNSNPIKGTAPNKTKMNWWQYWIGHCWMTGWQTIGINFRVWGDLMGSSYANYDLPRTVEDPEAECIEWFWAGLNEDDVYPKEFLEYLMQMVEDIELGKVETYSFEEVMENLKDSLELDDD